MSADGEIEVQVTAEGTDEAAQELADGDGGGGVPQPGGGGGGGGRGGGLRGALKGGIFLAALKIIIGLLGPLSDFLGAIFKVLQAFLAPIALIIVRLLTPFLRFFIRLLPMWMDFITSVMPAVENAAGMLNWGLNFIADVLTGTRDILSNTKRSIDNLPSNIWSFINRLPSMIGEQIGRDVPTFQQAGDGVRETVTDFAEDANQEVEQRTGINIMGGLGAFVERVERESNIDLP
jgi:hypothetical protein